MYPGPWKLAKNEVCDFFENSCTRLHENWPKMKFAIFLKIHLPGSTEIGKKHGHFEFSVAHGHLKIFVAHGHLKFSVAHGHVKFSVAHCHLQIPCGTRSFRIKDE